MLGSALYFPHIDIDDPAWLRSAILFWDEIQTITPSTIENPYRNEDLRICHSEGYLRPLPCDLHPEVIEELGRKILRLVDCNKRDWRDLKRSKNPLFEIFAQAGEITSDLESAFHEAGIHSAKMSPEMRQIVFQYGLSRMHHRKMPPRLRHMLHDMENAWMHPEKMSYIMRAFLEEDPFFSRRDGEWLLVDSRFANAYMSALAAQLSHKLAVSPLTSHGQSQGLSFRFLFDDIVDSTPERAEGAMIGVVMRGLKVDTSVSVEKLIKFREARKDQYLDFAGKIIELSDKINSAGNSDGQDLFNKAQEYYNKTIEPSLRSLKRELDQNHISTIWEGAYRAITISVPSAGALAYFTGLTGPVLLGAGAALAAADIGVKGYLAGRKARASNPFSYLHDINASFGLPKFE